MLGAGHYQIPVIRRALDLGCHVVVADYAPRNPGHPIASASEIVSTVDQEAMVDVARRHGVNGVLTYGSDVSVPTVAYVAERLGLPGSPSSAARLLQRKDSIRELQRELGLPHPRFVAASSAELLADAARREGLPFPALLKPADSSGSKGQSVARSVADLFGGFAAAQPFSRCGVVVAEEIRRDDVTELGFEALIEDGRLIFGHYGHNWFCDATHPRVPVGEIYPGGFDASLMAEIDRQIQLLVTASGVTTGCMNFDALLSGGEVVIVDLGLRSGGNFVPDAVWFSSGVDLTTAAIHAALGACYPVPSLHVSEAKCIVSYILHSHSAGRFRSMQIDPAVAPALIETRMFVHAGDEVAPYTRGDAALGVILFEQPGVASAHDLVRRLPHPCPVSVD